MICKYCGCTNEQACLTEDGPCLWIDRTHTVCSACVIAVEFRVTYNSGVAYVPKIMTPDEASIALVWRHVPPGRQDLIDFQTLATKHHSFVILIEAAQRRGEQLTKQRQGAEA